jgi:shingomyelin synthase
LVGIHYYYRAVTMYVTVLPKPNEHYECAPKSPNTTALVIFQRVLKLLSGMGLTINGKHIYCGDYIYSGHTMTLLMTYLVIKECKLILETLLNSAI